MPTNTYIPIFHLTSYTKHPYIIIGTYNNLIIVTPKIYLNTKHTIKIIVIIIGFKYPSSFVSFLPSLYYDEVNTVNNSIYRKRKIF